MKTTNQEDPVQHFYEQVINALSTQRFVLGFIGTGFTIILLLGAHIFSIVFGIFFGLLLLALTFELPYRLLHWIFRESPTHLVRLPLQRIVFNCVSLVIPAFFIYIGVRGLHNFGFCTQALIC